MKMRIEGPGRPLVQVQIVTYNSESHIGRCLQSLAKQTAVIDRVLVIDNASTDSTTAIVRAANVPVLQMERNVGYAAGHNQGFRRAIEHGMDVVVTLNPDVELDPQYIEIAVESLWKDPRCGAVTGKLIRPNGLIDSAGLEMQAFYHVRDRGAGQSDDGRWARPGAVWGVCGAAAVYRVQMLRDIALANGDIFDESFFIYKEDVELCWRATRAGWGFWYEPRAVAVHVRGWRRGSRVREVAAAHSFANQIALLIRHVPNVSLGLLSAVFVELTRYVWLAITRPRVWARTTRFIAKQWKHHWRVRRELGDKYGWWSAAGSLGRCSHV